MSRDIVVLDSKEYVNPFEDGEEYADVSSHVASTRMREGPTFSVNSGLPSLDRVINGFHAGELVAISGPTKNGKTLLAQTFTAHFSDQHVFSYWLSYEVMLDDLVHKFGNPLPTFFSPNKLRSKSMEWILFKCASAIKDHSARVIFIDNLHYTFDILGGDVSNVIGGIVRQFKDFARDHEVVVFLLCHTVKDDTRKLTYASIRDSSFIPQESDTTLLIYREEGTNVAKVRVECHRRTGAQETLTFVKDGPYLCERDRFIVGEK